VLIDARTVAPGSEFACDLCVVGAGPAGIAIVDRLRESGLTIVLLESGGFDPETPTQALFRGENEGHAYYRLDTCRFRLFGGSSNRWGGWCRPLEPTDFEPRSWLAWSGWPIRSESLEPYHAETAKLFELADASFDLASLRERLPAPFELDGSHFESVFFRYSPETNFGEVYRARLLAAPNVTTIIHANLTQIELAPESSRVERLQIAALSRAAFSVRPRAVVVAAGGIENARLLLASRADRETGLGNEYDMVGRFFMEHLHVPVGHMIAQRGRAGRRFYRKAMYDDLRVRGVITPTAAAQERLQLLSTSIAIEPASYSFGTPFLDIPPALAFGPIRLYRQLRRSRMKGVVGTIKQNAERASGLAARFVTWNASRAARARAGAPDGRTYSLYFRSEQAPDPESRVMLADRRDALGIPLTRLNWRVNRVDLDAISGWLEVFDRDIRTRGLGRVIPPVDDRWQNEIIGGPHHIGATRMSADPRHGVVDENCRVHSVDNLYVAGCSVFATGGYANPTFTLVALALRLADTLRDRLGKEYSIQSR
jgi:choline dehydrogenase-like flavoprotein